MPIRTSITDAYQALVVSGKLEADSAQRATVEKLGALAAELTQKRGLFRKRPEAKGLYLYGPVGRGKSMLMDLFFAEVPVTKKRRVHFHAFMLEVHARLHVWRQANPDKDDPLPAIAAEVAKEADLLCFDEFQVTDIADAMLLSRLFEALFSEGITVVATSNRVPEDLYKDGLQRDRFLPFIALIRQRLEVMKIAGPKDYRLEHMQALETVWFTPLGKKAEDFMMATFAELTGSGKPKTGSIRLQGRTLIVPAMCGDVAWFRFGELCGQPLGAADYIELAREFTTLLLQDIPELSKARKDEAKRFVTLIDELYEHRTNLICTAEVAPDKLYTEGQGSFEFERTVSRLIEMQSAEYVSGEHRG